MSATLKSRSGPVCACKWSSWPRRVRAARPRALRRKLQHYRTTPPVECRGRWPPPGPISRNYRRRLPPACFPPKRLNPRVLESFCLQGLDVRQMAKLLNCHNSHVCRQLRKHGLQTVIAARRAASRAARRAAVQAQAPAASPAISCTAPAATGNRAPEVAARSSVAPLNQSWHSREAARGSNEVAAPLSWEEPESLALRVPRHLQRDVDTLNRRPNLSLHRRGPALRRVARWFIAERTWQEVERTLRRYKTALHANAATGCSYRLARKIQDQVYGRRIGRGVAWS